MRGNEGKKGNPAERYPHLVMRSPGMRPRPVDLDFDFEVFQMAWKEAREPLNAA
jgi:hypothetical protein